MAKYLNAKEVLPEDLLRKVQEHIQGAQLYVPRPTTSRRGWGKVNGTHARLKRRNDSIRRDHEEGMSIPELMDRYYLGYDSIRKIIYSKDD